jgi:cytokinesis protein
LILINGILTVDDFELRIHHRSQMEAAGLRKILDRCREFQHEALDRQIAAYQALQAEDQEVLVRNFNEELLRDLSDPYDVYRAIISSIEGTQAFAYFLSAMQHLLLIREEPHVRTRYYQLIDELVTSIVLDKKQNFSGGLQSAIGVSVSRLVAQFGEQDRAKELELQIGEVRRELVVVRLQREGLEAEVRQGGEGLVGTLKTKLATTEEKLKTSRLTSEALVGRLGEQKRGYEEQIQQLELQISELFKMLRNARNNLGNFESTSGSKLANGQDREDFVSMLEKQMERKKTIGILEGRHLRKKKLVREQDMIQEEGEGEGEGEPDEDAPLRPLPAGVVDGRLVRRKARGNTKLEASAGRISQFEDPEEAQVQAHIEDNLAKGPGLVVRRASYSRWHR